MAHHVDPLALGALLGTLLLLAVTLWWLCRYDGPSSDGEDDGGGGSGGPPPPRDPPSDGPAWWPEFEREFARYVDAARHKRGRLRRPTHAP